MTNSDCSKCSGENRIIVPDDDGHWHWEECPACNGFEDAVLAENVCFDGWGDAPPFGVGVVEENYRTSPPYRFCFS